MALGASVLLCVATHPQALPLAPGPNDWSHIMLQPERDAQRSMGMVPFRLKGRETLAVLTHTPLTITWSHGHSSVQGKDRKCSFHSVNQCVYMGSVILQQGDNTGPCLGGACCHHIGCS